MALIHFGWHRLDDLSGPAVHELIRIRESVFVVEQACAYQEADELDIHAWHLVARAGSGAGDIAAYLRVVDPGYQYAEPAIGRVLTTVAYRRAGWGRPLMREGIARTRAAHGRVGIRISAQSYLQVFYERLGFTVVGEPYLEDDIPHIEMWLPPPELGTVRRP